ncbi:Rad52/22 double-strand break repair protein [Gemmatirosa kalamazoonensis]|uniref:Rad52/22 double-strand break repair protein n=1 Tax=Gemmatirosa kalamazoonensis TaxID=861299 RepID=W0RNE0_9BACT|nr:Rad52/Rad22 family DNA repair protein [Gemmatirosa kalamazoonensis]AHG90968.1 Rad52/22 double-strand break repair protein [Gemmatirosa kalamazoonensis]
MIARHETQLDKTNIWSALAASLPAGVVSWRQDGRSVQRDGRWYARFVAYIDANTVRERLDAVVPGEWDLTLDLLPPLAAQDEDGHVCSFKARLQILGVIREDVGTGRDYKSAATDAFKRAAVRFGIGHELYALEPNWVEVDGDGRYAKPVEDPQAAYDRRTTRRNGNGRPSEGRPSDVPVASAVSVEEHEPRAEPAANGNRPATAMATDPDAVSCPKCGGRMWDNRLSKRNPKAPDFKCRDRSCDGVVWPPRDGKAKGGAPATVPADEPDEIAFDSSPLGATADDEIPF